MILYYSCLWRLHFCASALWMQGNQCGILIVCLYIFGQWRSKSHFWVSLTGLTQSWFCACPNHVLQFPVSVVTYWPMNNFSAISWREQVAFWMMTVFILFFGPTHSVGTNSLLNNSSYVNMSLHSNALILNPSKPVMVLLFNVTCLEAIHTNCIV